MTTTEVTDRKDALQAMVRRKATLALESRACWPIGYVGRPFALAVTDTLGAMVQIAKRNALYTFAVIP